LFYFIVGWCLRMVKLKALKDCKIAFKYKGEVIKFEFKQGDIINKIDTYIIDKLINTKLIIIID